MFGVNYERASKTLQKRERNLKSGPATVKSRAVKRIQAGNSVFGVVIQLPLQTHSNSPRTSMTATAQQQANLFTLISYGGQIDANNQELVSQPFEESMDDHEPPCDVAGGSLWCSLDLQDALVHYVNLAKGWAVST